MRYKVFRTIEGQLIGCEFVSLDEFLAGMAAKGFRPIGYNSNPRNRAELQGQPMFFGLCGPMYDGPGGVRYEDAATYDIMST